MLPIALIATLAASPTLRTEQRWWSTSEGLPQSSVTAIAQGPQGLLYVGTFGGAARFDARQFERSGPAPWSTIRVTAVAVDEQQTQWFGLQDGGVARITKDGKEEQLPTPPGHAGHAIWDITLLGTTAWVVSEGGAARWDGGWTAVDMLPESVAIEADEDGVWVGGSYGLVRCTPECVAVDLGPMREINGLAKTAGGVVAVGPQGAQRVVGQRHEQLDDQPIQRVAVTPNGDIWFSRDTLLWRHGVDGQLDLGDPLRALFADRESSVWVGGETRGLARIVERDWELAELPSGALPLVQRRDGTVWTGAACGSGGVVSVDDPSVRINAPGCVRALAVEDDDNLLIAADRVLWRWTQDAGLSEIVNVDHLIHAVLPSEDGIWIGTDTGGAFVWSDQWLEPVDVGDTRVLALAKGERGVMWIGTHRGLVRYHADEGWRKWTRADGAPLGAIRALHVDAHDTILMGSYGGGLGVLRDGALHRLTADSGLRDNVVSAIVDDGKGSLWLNGNRGLQRLSRSELETWLNNPAHRVRVRHWATPEGNGGGQPSGLVRDDGALLFPTVAGVVALSPRNVAHNPIVPEVVLLGATVDDVALVPGQLIEAAPGPGRVQIEFTAATLRRPDQAQLMYRRVLPGQGAEEGWSDAGDDRRAVWGSLPPGSHIIELRVVNEDGFRSATMRLRFELATAWHDRTVVWAVLAAVLALLGLAIHRVRTRVVQLRNAALTKEIQQRQQAEAALRVSETHYRHVFEAASDALFVVDRKDIVRRANPAAETLVGDTVVGRPLASLFGAESEEHGARLVLRNDDTQTWVALIQLPFEDDRTLARAANVTARVAADAERRAMSARLAQAERMEAVGRLAGGIAHDFNNLLTAIGGTAEILAVEAREQDRTLVGGLQQCVDRGAKLTRQLLAFARRQQLDPRPTDPATVVHSLEAILRPSLRDDVTLTMTLPRARIGVQADATYLELALVNLVLNAQDAMPKGGRIHLSIDEYERAEAQSMCDELVDTTTRWVCLEVDDNGQGIDHDDIQRVLEPFFTTREDGTGLGLPSVQGFAQQSGGALQLESSPGRGTRARIWLPWVRPPAAELVAMHSPRRQQRGAARLIVCDDDDMVRQTVVEMLRHGGYDVSAFGDPLQLLDAFDESFECDLLVLDVLMPGLSGPQLAERLLRRRPQLPVVFISGYTRDQVGDDLPGPLLGKPFQVAALLDLIADTLSRSRQTESA